jgi:(2Fe-2S) ferredoxin
LKQRRIMEQKPPPFRKYIFVCENQRTEGEVCCGPHSMGEGYVERLKEFVKNNGLKGQIRVSRTGCLDICVHGPNILVYPEGRWYSGVTLSDLETIIEKELKPEVGKNDPSRPGSGNAAKF